LRLARVGVAEFAQAMASSMTHFHSLRGIRAFSQNGRCNVGTRPVGVTSGRRIGGNDVFATTMGGDATMVPVLLSRSKTKLVVLPNFTKT